MRKVLSILCIAFVAVLGGCQMFGLGNSSNNNNNSGGGTSGGGGSGGGSSGGYVASLVGGGLALPFTNGDGVPELRATPTITPNTLASTGSVTVSVPVDTDVGGVGFTAKILDANASTVASQTGKGHFGLGDDSGRGRYGGADPVSEHRGGLLRPRCGGDSSQYRKR